jgi:hypothetical protein
MLRYQSPGLARQLQQAVTDSASSACRAPSPWVVAHPPTGWISWACAQTPNGPAKCSR